MDAFGQEFIFQLSAREQAQTIDNLSAQNWH